MGKTVVATIAAASILLGGVVSASAAEPAPTGGETNGGAEFPSEAVSSTTSSDQPDLFYWGEKISYGDETVVFFDPRFWPTDALMNKDTVEKLLKESGATADQQEILYNSARGVQAFAAGKAVFVAVLALLGLAGAYEVWAHGVPQLPQLPSIQLPFL